MSARPLFKVDNAMSDSDRIGNLERRLATEREKRIAAEANAKKWRALLLREQVKHLPAKEN